MPEDFVVWAVVALIMGAVILGSVLECREHDNFMAECQRDHKRYECDERWRLANPPAPVTYVQGRP